MHMRHLISLMESTVEHIDALTGPLHDQAVAAFNELANGQRYGPPEKLGGASLRNRGIHVSGLYAGLTEHVGDITHRMAQEWDHYQGSYANVLEKVELGLRRVAGRPSGSEIIGQVQRNYAYQTEPERDEEAKNYKYEQGRFTGTMDDWMDVWRDAGSRYADAHAKLIVWNEAQWHAREAAVAAGRLSFASVGLHLLALKHHMGSREDWIAYAGQVSIMDGQIRPFIRP